MKKLLFALIIGFVSCQTQQKKPEPIQPKVECPEQESFKTVVRDKDGKLLLELTEEEFDFVFGQAKKYVQFLKLSRDEQALKKVIEVVKMNENTYSVKIKINEDIVINSTVLINNEELNKLREKMKRLHNEQPNVSQTRINDTTFKIDMSIDDVKWTTVVDVESVKERFDWTSYWFGFGTAAIVGLIVAVKAKALLFFLL